MKIEEVIDRLQKIQKLCPGIDITDGSAALYYIDVLPAYYDGCYTRLKQDESRSDEYNIVGAKIMSEGYKCVLHFMSARTLCWDDQAIENPDFFEYDENAEKKEKRFIDEELLRARSFNEEIGEKFIKEVLEVAKKAKIVQIEENNVDIYSQFYTQNSEGNTEKLCFGHGKEIVESGLFEKIENAGCIEWRLKNDD